MRAYLGKRWELERQTQRIDAIENYRIFHHTAIDDTENSTRD